MPDVRALRFGAILALAGLVHAACGGEDETETQTETRASMGREGPEGCYVPGNMRCDCTVVQADCTEEIGVWTEGCETCVE